MLYGTPFWHPTTSENFSKLESIHRRCLRFIYGKNPTDKEKTSLPTIQQQLLYNDLTFFNSCTTGKTNLNTTRKVMQGREIRGLFVCRFPTVASALSCGGPQILNQGSAWCSQAHSP
jgi:hypothetical protein